MDPGRRRHYGDFYDPGDAAEVALVWGNCQAEAIRALLAGSPGTPLPTVRVPPVHELTADDLSPLAALLPRVRLLVAQPVRPGYRGLPIGTAEVVIALGAGARIVTVPVVRYEGLQPWSAIVRHPTEPSLDPPVVPYHDLRTLSSAAGHPAPDTTSGAALREVAAASLAELARREQATDVAVSDVLDAAGAGAMHTLNHPGNQVLIELVRRVQAHLGLPVEADDPGRELLGGTRAPLEEPVVDALGLDATPRPGWSVGGSCIDPVDVAEAQMAFYAAHPPAVAAGLERHAGRLALLGL